MQRTLEETETSPLRSDPTDFHVEFDYETGYDYACCLTGTVSAIATAGLALLCYPCVTKLVRKEVDSQKCTITENRVVLETGWLNKSTRYIPLDCIQDVNVQENYVQRHFGVKGVEIQTAGVGIGRLPEAYLLAPKDASAVREAIMSRRDQLMAGRFGNAHKHGAQEVKSAPMSGYDSAVVRELRELKESVLRIEAQIGEGVKKLDARDGVKALD
ncbi:hypothetical protein Gpo141_00001864 [Globisporangium polare]